MIKILELFSGYGTATFALKQLGIKHELVGYSDIDKYANQCFQQNHGGKELGDVTKIDPEELDDFDLLTGGFPCQAFSSAGKQKGESDTRGTLFNEIIRIAEVKKPKYMLLENVKGLLAQKFKETFDKILSELDRIGYIIHWKVYNTKKYGIPQNRERVFFVCFHKDYYNSGDWVEPKEEELKIFLKDILEEEVDENYFLSEVAIKGMLKSNYNDRKPQTKNVCSTLKVGGDKKCIQVFDKAMGKYIDEYYWINKENDPKRPSYIQKQNGNHSEAYRYYNANGIIQTVKPQQLKIIQNDLKFRKLTPKEYFRLQGFLNDEVNLEGLSNTQQYKLAGNGQSVNVVKKIFEGMFNRAEGRNKSERMC